MMNTRKNRSGQPAPSPRSVQVLGSSPHGKRWGGGCTSCPSSHHSSAHCRVKTGHHGNSGR